MFSVNHVIFKTIRLSLVLVAVGLFCLLLSSGQTQAKDHKDAQDKEHPREVERERDRAERSDRAERFEQGRRGEGEREARERRSEPPKLSEADFETVFEILAEIRPESVERLKRLHAASPERAGQMIHRFMPEIAKMVPLKERDPEMYAIGIEGAKIRIEMMQSLGQLRRLQYASKRLEKDGEEDNPRMSRETIEEKTAEIMSTLEDVVRRGVVNRLAQRKHELAQLEARLASMRQEIAEMEADVDGEVAKMMKRVDQMAQELDKRGPMMRRGEGNPREREPRKQDGNKPKSERKPAENE